MKVFVKDLTVSAIHGVKAREREQAQPFVLNIVAECKSKRAQGSDDVAETVNYSDLKRKALEVMSGPPVNLLEKLAGAIADRILEDLRIWSVVVEITKPSIWDDATPGVSITKERSEPWAIWPFWIGRLPW